MSVLQRDHVNPPMPGRRLSVTVLEAQNVSDASNHPQFPGTLLRAGDEYRQHGSYRFEQIV